MSLCVLVSAELDKNDKNGSRSDLQEKPCRTDAEEDFGVLPIREVFSEVMPLLMKATLSVVLQRSLLCHVCFSSVGK